MIPNPSKSPEMFNQWLQEKIKKEVKKQTSPLLKKIKELESNPPTIVYSGGNDNIL